MKNNKQHIINNTWVKFYKSDNDWFVMTVADLQIVESQLQVYTIEELIGRMASRLNLKYEIL